MNIQHLVIFGGTFFFFKKMDIQHFRGHFVQAFCPFAFRPKELTPAQALREVISDHNALQGVCVVSLKGGCYWDGFNKVHGGIMWYIFLFVKCIWTLNMSFYDLCSFFRSGLYADWSWECWYVATKYSSFFADLPQFLDFHLGKSRDYYKKRLKNLIH